MKAVLVRSAGSCALYWLGGARYEVHLPEGSLQKTYSGPAVAVRQALAGDLCRPDAPSGAVEIFRQLTRTVG